MIQILSERLRAIRLVINNLPGATQYTIQAVWKLHRGALFFCPNKFPYLLALRAILSLMSVLLWRNAKVRKHDLNYFHDFSDYHESSLEHSSTP